ncbi:uncharacterized protein ACRADG_001422 isoform 1-T3 [Cochliomyia hominivorax]
MDPGRHHDFLANTDERSSRSTYYGREIPEITAHHYYGPATTTTRPINTNSTRKPCGCVTTGSGTTAGSITCNGCRLNPSEEGGWSTMTNTNQTAVEHMQRGGVGGGMTAADYHHRMSTESSSLRSNVRQSSMYIQQHAPPSQSLQQQHTQPQSSHGVSSMVPSQQQQQQHHVSQHVVGTMSGQSRQSYWPQSSGAASTSQNYGPAGDEHMGGLPPPPSQLQIDISVTRRTAPAPHDYGPYKTISMSSSATHNNPHLSSSSGVGGGGGGGVYQLSTSSNSLHSRVSAIVGAAGPGPGPGPNNSPHPYMTKDQQRIYEHQKYSTSSVTASKLPYNSTPASSAIYDSHHHHHINNQAIGKSLPPTIDHHVINPSNLPASKEQHPSPNYARKCPQMYAPEEQTTAHQHLYMSTPQFSSDKFTRASPQQSAPAPPPPPSNDFSKLRESPSGSAYMVAPHSGDKYATSHLQSSHLRESPQYATHASSLPRNSSSSSSSYYANSQTQNPSKILPPDMSPIIMKQSPHHHPQQQQHSQSHHYQYSKSPLPPPTQPPPPSHMQTQQTTIPPPHSSVTTQHMAAKTGPPPPPPAPIPAPGHSQRYLMDNVKREDLEIYENPNQTPTRIPSGSSMYINPYNTPPPTGDNCCKEVALSTSSSPYNTGSATPNYRVESPQFYPTKYAKLAINENLSSSKHSHSLINQNTPPPSRAPSQQRGQHQANYYYEGNSHSAPSPAAATAASPSPSALLTTTSQTPMHHPEYLGPTNMPSQHVYATQPTLAAQHQTPSSAALRHNDLMISVQPSAPPPPTHHTTSHNSYERAIHHPNQPSSAAVVANPPPPAAVAKHVLTHPTSSTQPPLTGSNAGKPGTKHQKPNYRDLINQTLAIRNATSEEELNMQIIKKTLNVDTQNIRPPPSGVSSRSMASLPSQTHMGVNERIPAPLREPSTKLKSMAPMGSSVLVAPSNIAAAATNLPMPSSARVIEVPEVIPPRICIKQEDDKPTSSSGGTTASSPLDLSMRTVKTKADSTEYKYQQRPTRLAGTTASSTTTPEGRYTLPRVDSTPIFSVHAFEPGAVSGGTSNTVSSRSSSSRHNSLERRIYTPPNQTPLVTQGGGSGGSSSSLAGNISPYNPTSTQHNIPNSSTQPTPTQYYGANNEAGSMTPRRSDLAKPLPSQTLAGSYENSLVIKTAPKLNNINSDLVVRPSAITQPNAAPANLPQTNAQPPNRPSVLETNPYASVIKTEPKRYSETPGGVSPRQTLAAVERLPPDTSIMALPARNPYGVVRTAIQTNHNNNNNNNNNISSSNPSPQSNYSLACEKNPNFLGRKRHLQEYSQQQMSLNEPEAKLKRYRDLSPQPTPLASTAKPIIPMRPADISVIAVNEVVNMEERKSLLNHNKPRITEDVISNTSVIASTNTNYNSKVIVNNVNHTSNTSSSPSVLMVCKQEPLTPTGEGPQHLNATACVKNEMPANTFSSRIRTKAELKGFTFNPPPLPPSTVEQTPPERNSTPPSPSSSPPPPLPPPPPAEVTIKQEEQEEELDREEESIVHTNVKIKQEVKIDLPSIPGLDDEFEEKSLLDFGWNNTCNNFVEQLLTRPSPKKKTLNLLNHNKTPLKDPDMVVSSTENMLKENNDLSNLESADNTTRSSFNRLETGVDSNFNLNNLNQDSLNSQGSQGFNHKKLSKTEREKKRYHQEKRLAERLKAKDSSSESEDELDKRKTERLKKPLMKAKHKAKTHKTGANSSSSTSLTDKNRFSDCGSDSSGTEIEQQTQQQPQQQKSLNILKDIKQEKMDEEEKEEREKGINEQIKNNEKCDIKTKQDKQEKEDDGEKEKEESNKKKMENKKTNKQETSAKTKEDNSVDKIKQENKSSTETSEQEEDEEDENEDEEQEEEDHKSKTKLNKQALNTMTRSKRKQELEQQLANSKVLRNDKIIRNFSNANSTNKIKRKYTRKYNTVNSLLESGGLSRESGIMKSTRLKAKLERNGGKLNLIKTNITIKQNNLKIGCNKEAANNKLKSPKAENVHDRNDIDLYRFKRALKVPPSLINIKHPGAHKAASLPDLERHAEALEAYAKKREKNCLNKQNKLKSTKSNKHIKSEKGAENKQQTEEQEEPKSIIDLLHSRVTKASGMNVRNKTTTTTAVYRPTKPCCTTSSNNNNCGMFSETSQTTESSELQMLPELKKDSDLEDENDDNDSTNGKKRHFSIFDTKVLPTKTRTESKLQQKKENIREIFVGDDRPASAPPEMTQMLDSSEKMTYEQKYEQFLQQMNIVVSADTLGRLSKSAAAKRLGNTATTNGNQDLNSLNIKQEEGDTESTSVIDADDLKEDQKSLPNHFRKRRGRYLRRKGSSGFDYIRKKKKPSTAANQQQSNVNNQQNNGNNGGNGGGSLSLQTQFNIKSERYDVDEYEHKIKTEDDVSREIQKWVLNKGVGQSTMHKAARQGYIDVIVYCLDRMGMNPDQKDNAGYTPLHEACTNGWLNIARVLLQYGANHSEAAHSGIRPLHEASENDHEEIVRLLLSYGADPLLATYAGQTPLMLASSKSMRDILSNHLIDVQSMGPDRKPWRFNGPWEVYDPSECGYNVFEGAPNSVCDMSRALLRRGSLTNNQMYQNNKKLQNVLNTTTHVTNTANATTTNNITMSTKTTTTTTAAATINNLSLSSNTTTSTTTNSTTLTSTSNSSAILNNISSSSSSSSSSGSSGSGTGSCTNNNNCNSTNTLTNSNSSSCNPSSSSSLSLLSGIENQQQTQQLQQQQQIKGENSTKTVMEKCAVVLDNIDRFNSVRLFNDNKPEILVENSDSDGEMFEFEEADVLLPPLYLLKDEGTQDKWVLLNDLCNLLKVKSKDTLLNKIYPSTTSSSSASAASAHKSHMRELKMSDFLEKATCLQLLCAGEKLNICASKVVLIKYNENVRNLLGVKTILMKF